MIHASALIGPDCRVGENAEIGPFCTVGLDGPEPATVIGAGANLRSMSVIYRAVTAGLRLSTGHGVLVREFTTLGDDVSVGSHCVVEHHVVVESGVRLHSNCFVPEYSVLEQECWLGPGVIVTNSRYPAQPDSKERLAGVRIQRGAVIGAGVVLL
ncbi:MAG: transferase, partial [Actinomycetota bacterium]|nr:transferase [Actinomycetota bacterium]